MPDWVERKSDHLILKLYVTTRASADRVVGIYDGRLKVAISTPPVDGAANKAILRLLSKILSIPKSAVEIIQGETSKRKQIKLPLSSNIKKLEEIVLNNLTKEF